VISKYLKSGPKRPEHILQTLHQKLLWYLLTAGLNGQDDFIAAINLNYILYCAKKGLPRSQNPVFTLKTFQCAGEKSTNETNHDVQWCLQNGLLPTITRNIGCRIIARNCGTDPEMLIGNKGPIIFFDKNGSFVRR